MDDALDVNFFKNKLLLPLAVPMVYTSQPKYKARNLAIHLVRWDPKQILVFNLLRCTTEQDLRRIFSVYGRITKVDLMLNDFNEEAYNHAYITFYAEIGARRAINSKYRLSNGAKLEIAAEKDPLNYLPDKYTSSPPRSTTGSNRPPPQNDLSTPSVSSSTLSAASLSSDDYYFDNSPPTSRFPISQTDFEDELYCNELLSDDSE